MVEPLRYRRDLYAGTAEDYDRYRPPYPAPLLDDLRARVPITGDGRLLDLACGTGQIAFALAPDFRETVAVDQEEELVAFTRRKAEARAISDVRCIAAPAESVPLEGEFALVTIGNAFHRLDRALVVSRLATHLRSGACIALLWSDAPWRGWLPWQRALKEALDDWTRRLGAEDRIPAGWEDAMARTPHEEVLRRAGLVYEGRFEFAIEESWTIESLVGLTYSTSFLSRRVLGSLREEFEADVRARLIRYDALTRTASSAYELARKPG